MTKPIRPLAFLYWYCKAFDIALYNGGEANTFGHSIIKYRVTRLKPSRDRKHEIEAQGRAKEVSFCTMFAVDFSLKMRPTMLQVRDVIENPLLVVRG